LSVNPFDLPTSVQDASVYRRSVAHLRARNIVLPLFSELAAPHESALHVRADAADLSPPSAGDLFRVHWFNRAQKLAGRMVPAHVILPEELTGVAAPIVVMLGRHFPLIRTHKVLAAYACLALRLASGGFDPTRQRAIWPSTGNYCRGGVAMSRILGCRGVAVLPEGMSAERFTWLENWVSDPADIVRTKGSESNVKEIYDACAELARNPENVILNQFSEFPNYLAHHQITGAAAARLFEGLRDQNPRLSLAAFVAATGSGGTLAAGDFLKDEFGCKNVAVEPIECPTLLYNGFGEHNIQGIGDKHVPLIHNVMNTDLLVGISDEAVADLDVLFNTPAGRAYLIERRWAPDTIVAELDAFGFSSLCNILAAIKIAKRLDLGPDQAIVTIATDDAALYASERELHKARRFARGFDGMDAAEAFGRWVLGGESDHVQELDHRDRNRVFNLGYYTWVEQQGIPVEDFERRRSQGFWRDLRARMPAFDELIAKTNRDVGLAPAA
jgi:cysteine synthase